MSVKKGIIVTAVMTAMVIIIAVCLLRLGYKIAFYTINGVFAFAGIVATAAMLFFWLTDEDEPVIVKEASSDEDASQEADHE